MEHLQLVEGATPPTLSIPLVVKSAPEFPYTFGQDNFIHFPEQHLREIQLIYPDLSARVAFASLVQSWLYFGTLSEFLKQSISVETLSRRNTAGERVLCTSALQDLRAGWVASLPRRNYFTAGIRQLESRRCAVLLARATWAYTRIEDLSDDDALVREVLFSVKLVLSSLCQTVGIVLGQTPTLDAILASLAFLPAAADGGSKTDFLLWDYMIGNGWCPYQVNNLLRIYTPTSMVYLSSIARKKRPGDHQDCLKAGCCKAAQIDWATFQTPHASTGCSCAHVAVDEQQIMDKIKEGQIPLLLCTRKASGNFAIELTHVNMQRVFEARTSYIAVSHVWADGLGNPHANSLPKCQFEKLYDKLRALSRSGQKTGRLSRLFHSSEEENDPTPLVFWMDVFCIPIHKPNSPARDALKKEAIGLMDLIYSCASQVLVLDSEMETVTSNSGRGDEADLLKSSTEALARFATSIWMGRSWTLQEGALAAALWGYYSGSPVRHKSFHAFHAYLADEAPPELLAAGEELQNQAALPFVGRSARDMAAAAQYCRSEREVQFLQVWNSLIGRSTTQPEDFHCIVANLLDFSVKELFKLDDPDKSDEQNRCERMKAIILAQKRVPMQLFCLPRSSARNGTDDMPWLPERPAEPRLTDDAFLHAVKVSSKGFAVELPCLNSSFFVWPPQGSANNFCLNIPTRNGAHPHVSLSPPGGRDISRLDLFIYLNASPKAHCLQSGCRRTGAAFEVTERQATSATIQYLCPLTFRHCWNDHEKADSPEHVTAAAVSKLTSVLISGPNLHKALKFRRPLRFGSGLVATTLSKVSSFGVLISFGGGLVIILLLFLPVLRNSILDEPVSASSLPLLYLFLIGTLVQYLVVFAFVSARHLSAPWVRETYLRDTLPWQLRALYSEKIPTDTKALMFLKRVCNAFLTQFIYRNAPYDICADQPAGRRAGFLRALGRIFPRWRRRPNAMSMEQEYTDDGDSDIQLLPTGESNRPFRDFPASPSRSTRIGDDDEPQGFDCIIREHAERLLEIRRALVETRAEDTGGSFRDGLASTVAAILWLVRIDSRRGLLDFLYDIGVPIRRRGLRNWAM